MDAGEKEARVWVLGKAINAKDQQMVLAAWHGALVHLLAPSSTVAHTLEPAPSQSSIDQPVQL